MAARSRLSRAYFNSSLLVAGILGLATDSLLVFGAVLAILVLGSIASGEIRMSPRRRH